jgi:hypothetical protein
VQDLNKENGVKLNKRDAQLFKMRESNTSLVNLTQSKKLDQRERLQTNLEDTRDMLDKRDVEVKVRN